MEWLGLGCGGAWVVVVAMGSGGLLGVAATPLMSAQMVKQAEEEKWVVWLLLFFLSFFLSLTDET